MSRGESKKNIKSEFPVNLGERVAWIRGPRTQAEFARLVGVKQSTLSKYERGMSPDPAVLHRIAVAGRTSMEWLLTGEGEAPPGRGAAGGTERDRRGPGKAAARMDKEASAAPERTQSAPGTEDAEDRLARSAPGAGVPPPDPDPLAEAKRVWKAMGKPEIAGPDKLESDLYIQQVVHRYRPSPDRRFPTAETTLGDALVKLLASSPGSAGVLLQRLAETLAELGESPWHRWLGRAFPPAPAVELEKDPATRMYGLAAPEWCRHWEQTESAVAGDLERAFPAGSRILEIGPGSGRDLARLLELGYDAWGVEVQEGVRKEAERRYPALAGRLRPGTLPGLGALFAEPFDGVLCANVLQEVPPARILPAAVELCALLRGGGRLLLVVPIEEEPGPEPSGRPPFFRIPPDGLQYVFHCLGCAVRDRRESPGRPGHPVTMLLERVDP